MPTDAVGFTGSVAALYEEHLVPLLFAPYAEDIAARVKVTNGPVLETAAGTGAVTRALAAALPESVRIVATDLNETMIKVAAARSPRATIRWQAANAMELPFDDASYEAVVCQFGAMFFPDKVAGFTEARRVLAPGGAFVFNVWGALPDNPVSLVVAEAVARFFPEDPPRFYERTPFGYHDADRIRTELAQAGFAHVTVDVVDKTTRCPSAAIGALGLCEGTPLRGEIEARGRLEDATAAAARALTARYGEGPFDNPMRALVVTARA